MNRPFQLVVSSVFIALSIWIVGLVTGTGAAYAHGKELGLTISSVITDEAQPLRRLYRVEVIFANDFDRVENAEVTLTGFRREDGTDLPPIRLTEMQSEAGVYIGEVTFPRFGEWELDIDVENSFGQGSGSANLIERVRPAVLSDQEEEGMRTEAARVQRLQLFFSFSWWPDIVSIIIRIGHSMSGLAFFGTVGLVIASAWISTGFNRIVSGPIGRYFLPISLLGLLGILLTGLYSAGFDAPNGTPGIYDISDLLELPYGDAYFAAFLVKPIMWSLLLIFTFRVHKVLVRPVRSTAPSGGAFDHAEPFNPSANLKRLTLIGSLAAVMLLADLAILIYIHYLSHLGVFLPADS